MYDITNNVVLMTGIKHILRIDAATTAWYILVSSLVRLYMQIELDRPIMPVAEEKEKVNVDADDDT